MTRAAAWYIDTIEARSGYAFASYRIADLSDSTALADNCQTVFIEAPHFVPERVGSRTLSLGAARAGFQTGLYLDDGESEVPFPTLDALTDFVRRAYGSGGSSDDGGATPPISPRPEGDAPSGNRDQHTIPEGDAWKRELSRAESGDVDPVDTLRTAHGAFVSLTRKATLAAPVHTESAFHALQQSHFCQAEGSFAAHRLARAALRLSIHVISFPTPPEFSESGRVLDGSRRQLFACISRLHLWGSIRLHLLADASMLKQVVATVSDVYDRRGELDWLTRYLEPGSSSVVTDRLTRLLQALLVPRAFPDWYLYEDIFWDLPRLDHFMAEPSNRFADLGRVIIPEYLIPQDYRPERVYPSLRNILSFGCNAFSQVAPQDQDAVFEMMLFAACYLNSHAVGGPHAIDWYGYPSSHQQASFNALELVKAALPWIRSNLPGYAFVQEVENSIAQTATVGR